MKKLLSPMNCSLYLYACLFFIGVYLRTAYPVPPGGPYWTFWLGEAIEHTFPVCLGSIVIYGVVICPEIIIKFRWRTGRSKVKLTERIFWLMVGLSMVIVGLFAIWLSLGRMLSNEPVF
jgi:hypothetical protein